MIVNNRNAVKDHAGILRPKKDQTTSAQLPSPLKRMPKASVIGKLLKIYSILGPQAGTWSSGKFWRYNCLIAKLAPDRENTIPTKLYKREKSVFGLCKKEIIDNPAIKKKKNLWVMHKGQGSKPFTYCKKYPKPSNPIILNKINNLKNWGLK